MNRDLWLTINVRRISTMFIYYRLFFFLTLPVSSPGQIPGLHSSLIKNELFIIRAETFCPLSEAVLQHAAIRL